MIEAVLPPLQRGALHGGVLLLVGTVAWRSFVAPWQPAAIRPGMGPLEARVVRVGLMVSLLLLPVWVGRLGVQLLDFRDPFVPIADDLRFLVFETGWGGVWLAQGGLLVLLVLTFRYLQGALRSEGVDPRSAPGRRSAPVGAVSTGPDPPDPTTTLPVAWRVAAVGVLGLVLTLALSSHARAVPDLWPFVVMVDAGHALAAGGWVGTLALILVLRVPGPEGVALLAGQLRSFSYLAMGGVAMLLSTGALLAGIHLAEFSNLWGTPYGRILLLKGLAAGGVLYLGYRNWRYGLPVVDRPEGARAVRRRVSLEVGAAAIVLLLTALLTGTPVPVGTH